jgi:hypothetical protein
MMAHEESDFNFQIFKFTNFQISRNETHRSTDKTDRYRKKAISCLMPKELLLFAYTAEPTNWKLKKQLKAFTV